MISDNFSNVSKLGSAEHIQMIANPKLAVLLSVLLVSV